MRCEKKTPKAFIHLEMNHARHADTQCIIRASGGFAHRDILLLVTCPGTLVALVILNVFEAGTLG